MRKISAHEQGFLEQPTTEGESRERRYPRVEVQTVARTRHGKECVWGSTTLGRFLAQFAILTAGVAEPPLKVYFFAFYEQALPPMTYFYPPLPSTSNGFDNAFSS